MKCSTLNLVVAMLCTLFTTSIFAQDSTYVTDDTLETAYYPPYDPILSTKTIDLSKPVGITPGAPGTTPTGGATYTIPIVLPAGINGMTPNLSLTYNSQGGNGIAGFGWNLSGLSLIGRSGKDVYHDGNTQPVTYTNSDAFVLDGMRLTATSGSNGGDGSVYATEVESFANIISYGGTSNNPDWFKVTSKDGTVMEFGHTTDSKFKTSDYANIMLWRLNRIIDVNGNYIDFVYDNTNRDSRIKFIKYTGNTNTSGTPYFLITFSYTIRNDKNTVYEAGGSLVSQYLLSQIKIFTDLDLWFKTYTLTYTYNNVHSLLNQVEETGSDDVTKLNSTVFAYGVQPQNTTIETSSIFAGTAVDVYSGDFTGDGISDIISSTYQYSDNIKYNTDYKIYARNSPTGPFQLLYTVPLNVNFQMIGGLKVPNANDFLSSDFNGDGREDILLAESHYENSSNRRILDKVVLNTTKDQPANYVSQNYSIPSTTDYTTGAVTPHNIINSTGNFILNGDFDGDGAVDFITMTAGDYGWFFGNRYHGFFSSPQKQIINKQMAFPENLWSDIKVITDAPILMIIDFDGDGKMELFAINGSSSTIYSVSYSTLYSTYSIQSIYSTTSITSANRVFVGDFNGDKKTDLLVRNYSTSWTIYFSNGKQLALGQPFTFNQTVNMTGSYSDDKIIVADFNGDGKSDILHGYNYFVGGIATTSKLNVYFFKGNYSTYPQYYSQLYDYNNILGFVPLTVADLNGDGRNDFINRNSYLDPFDMLYIKPNGQERLLQLVTNGDNSGATFTYKLLTDNNTFYNRTISLDNAANNYPYNYTRPPVYAVSKITVPNGIGGNINTVFNYQDAILHRAGRGFLGFKKILSTNNTTNIITETQSEINTLYGLLYPLKTKTYFDGTSENLSETQITTTFVDRGNSSLFDKRYFQRIDKTLNIDYVNGRASENNNTYDNYGNITTNIVKTGVLSGSTVTATETVTTTTTYSVHNTPVPAKPDNITVSNARSTASSVTKSTTFTYNTKGLPETTVEFAGTAKAVTTTFGYDNYGNTTSTIVSATGLISLSSTFTYDAQGQFLIAKQTGTGANAQSESYSYHIVWGKPTSITSSDCLTTTFEYDAFGRLKKTNLPEGYATTTTYNWDVTNGNVYYTLTSAPGNSDVKTWFDLLGRKTKTQMEGFNAQWLTQQITYDAKGNVSTQTNNYYSGESPIVTINSYDQYNRLTSTSNVLQTLNYTYTKLSSGQVKSTVTNGNATTQTSSKTTDATGKIVNSVDKGGQLDFTYDGWGNQTEVKHGSTILITNVYDSYGRQTSLTDKNAGTITYVHNAFGQLTNQTDANNNAYTMTYDNLERIKTRQGPEGTTTYDYYINGSCKNNSLSKVTGFNDVIKEYTYDNMRRLASEKVTMDDGSIFTTNYTYNQYGDLTQTTYPSGLIIKNVYDNNGILTSVNPGNNNGNEPSTLFTGTTMDGFGHYTGYSLGNGLSSVNIYNSGLPGRFTTTGIQDLKFTFDNAILNLTQRKDFIKNKTENFQYDDLNRLVSCSLGATQQLAMNYDGSSSFSMGNITSKTDAGNYVYNTNKIHAISYITNPVGPQVPPDVIAQTQQDITYTAFQKTSSVIELPYQVYYTYGPDYQRVKSILKYNNSVKETKYYVGNYEKQTTPSGTREIHYITGGNGLCAIIVKENGAYTYYFTYTDYLGSILTVTNQTGGLFAEQNFDAWGRYRNPNTWQYTAIPVQPDWLYRGYTGHEHLTRFNLINMNGRMYDPLTGRMMSPDNYVPDPFNTQAYNRYGYVMNNPFKYNDPSGEIIVPIIVGALFGAFVGATQADLNDMPVIAGAFKGAFIGAVGGTIGGSLAGAFSSWGAVGGGMAQGFIAGFTTGGLGAALNGSNIFSGAITGAISGALVGGAIGVIQRLGMKQEMFEFQDLDEVHPDEYFKSQEELNAYVNRNIGNVNKIESDFRTKIILANQNNIPDGFTLNKDGLLIRLSDGVTAGAVTTPIKGGWFNYASSTIHVAPATGGYYSNGVNVSQMTISHEILHAYHAYQNYWTYNKYSERATSTYSLAYGNVYKLNPSLLQIFRGNLGYYPQRYSWLNIRCLINMGIQ